jgi:hypothetical protein
MTVTIPWAAVEAAIGIGICVAVGAALGVVRVLWQMEGERRGQDRAIPA